MKGWTCGGGGDPRRTDGAGWPLPLPGHHPALQGRGGGRRRPASRGSGGRGHAGTWHYGRQDKL